MARTMTTSMYPTLGGGIEGVPVVPIGHTTVLTGVELHRIKTTLLHAEAKTQGHAIISEVCLHPYTRALRDDVMQAGTG